MLTPKDQRLIRVVTAIALGRWDELERVRLAAPEGEPDRAWREAVLAAHLFAGIPRQIEAYEVLEAAGGLGALDEDETRREPDLPDRGRAVFDVIYARNADPVRARLASFHPDFGDWVLGHAYGRVLARPGLALDRRELLAVATLAALGQDRQLASHARGCVHAGASVEDVLAALDVIEDLLPPERLERARAVARRFTASRGP